MDLLAAGRLISFVAARSGIGKTTYLEKLIAVLSRRGYRVVTCKHAGHAGFDLPGKDSWRHKQAGALAVGLFGQGETLILGEVQQDPRDILPIFPSADFILLEGFRSLTLPKIEVVRAATGREVVSPPEDLIAVVTDIPDLPAGVPCFPLDDAEPLADWLAARVSHISPAPLPALSHLDDDGRARMVDVSGKDVTSREATARGEIAVSPHTLALIAGGGTAKGDVLSVAQVAAIMAVKETSRLIPMCHPLSISGVSVAFNLNETENKVEIEVQVRLAGRTGVEMEALTGVSVAALTIYDMCKAVDRRMQIGGIRLVDKKGGRTGHFHREGE